MSGNVIGTVIGGFLALCGVVSRRCRGARLARLTAGTGWRNAMSRRYGDLMNVCRSLSIAWISRVRLFVGGPIGSISWSGLFVASGMSRPIRMSRTRCMTRRASSDEVD